MTEEFSKRMSRLGEAMANAGEELPPEQPSMEGQVTQIFRSGKEAMLPRVTDADLNWNDPVDLSINAWLMQAWIMEIQRKRGHGALIHPDDIKCLRQAQAALRLIPK